LNVVLDNTTAAKTVDILCTIPKRIAIIQGVLKLLH